MTKKTSPSLIFQFSKYSFRVLLSRLSSKKVRLSRLSSIFVLRQNVMRSMKRMPCLWAVGSSL